MQFCVKSQLSIVLPNKPGQVAGVAKLLADRRINVSGLMFVDTTSQGVVRFVAEESAQAQKIFEEAGYFVVSVQVLQIDFENRVGALFEVAEALSKAKINVDYAYGSDNPEKLHTRVIFKVSDIEKAEEIIRAL